MTGLTQADVARLSAIVGQWQGLRVVVAGDVILDEYLIGRAARLSREAPVPVLEFEERRVIPGGAANPAVNITALGGQAAALALIGADAEGQTLKSALDACAVDTAAVQPDASCATPVKTRILAHMGLRFPQQVARLDRVSQRPLSGEQSARLVSLLRSAAAGARCVLFSDYQLGMITPGLIDAARELNLPLAADSQGQFERYAGFDAGKCNADEAAAFLNTRLISDADFDQAARVLLSRLELKRCMVITRGADGATVAWPGGSAHCPAPETSDVYDTVGAGDTAVAVLALALTAGATPVDAVMLANAASGLVVRRVGNYAPGRDELLAALSDAAADTR